MHLTCDAALVASSTPEIAMDVTRQFLEADGSGT